MLAPYAPVADTVTASCERPATSTPKFDLTEETASVAVMPDIVGTAVSGTFTVRLAVAVPTVDEPLLVVTDTVAVAAEPVIALFHKVGIVNAEPEVTV